MIKINLITDDIKPYISKKSKSKGKGGLKIIVLVILLLSALSIGGYFLSPMVLEMLNSNYKDTVAVITQDTTLTLPKPGDYESKESGVKAEKDEVLESDKKAISKRKNSEEKSIVDNSPVPKIKKDNLLKKSTTIDSDDVTSVSKISETRKRKPRKRRSRTTRNTSLNSQTKKKISSKSSTVSSTRILNYIYNEHTTPAILFSKMTGLKGINKIRLNNPQTLYIEVENNNTDIVKSAINSSGIKVKEISVAGTVNLEATHAKMSGAPNLLKVTEIPAIETTLSKMVQNYGGYPVLKDNSKPIGKYFSFTVKYVIPSISYDNFLILLSQINAEYEGLGISKVVYDAKSEKMKLDVSIYAK